MCEGEFNLDERILCVDGNCIGLVGSDGRCKVCGQAYDGGESLPATPEATAPSIADMMVADETPATDASPATEPDTSEPDARVCCVDDNCVGIIGSDGRCGTCGKKP